MERLKEQAEWGRLVGTLMFVLSTCGCASREKMVDATTWKGPVVLSSPAGVASLERAESLVGFVRLASVFETQATTTFCGVASGTMALNSLDVKRPIAPEYGEYSMFTQASFFSGSTGTGLSEERVRREGMTLDELGWALQAQGTTVSVRHAERDGLDEFRRVARETLGGGDGVVLVNYARPKVQQKGGGHISPLGAYDPCTDSFLILDVARYRLPPVWVPVQFLWSAMEAVDDASKQSRGYVVVTAPQRSD